MSRQPFQILPLPRSLPSFETWGFGFSGLLLWLGTAPAMHAALGPQAIWVWLPGTVIGVLLNLQVRRLGTFLPDIAGGTPNYTTHLLKRFPAIARYGAMGYLLGWVSVPPMNAIILTDLIKINLDPLGVACPVVPLRIGFALLPYVVAFSGTRTLGILHGFFVFPALGFLLTFCLQGLGWLSWAPASPGLLPSLALADIGIAPGDWLKWFFIAVYAVYGCETASVFVADSRQPNITLRCLSATASVIPVVYLGGSWVMMRLAVGPNLGDSAYLNLVTAAQPFWGALAPALVAFLVTCGCLLSSTTAVSMCPRILFQLARDGYLPPVFAVVSRRGVLQPGLLFTLLLSLACLGWGNVARVVMVTGTGYLISMMAVHLGQWVSRDQPESRWPRWSLAFLGLEAGVLVLGGWAWGWSDWLLGLALPWLVGLAATQLPRLRLAPMRPEWWQRQHRRRVQLEKVDWVTLQVTMLIALVCSAVSIGWGARAGLDRLGLNAHSALFSILLITIAFVGVAIACWTSLPQVMAITEARRAVEENLAERIRVEAALRESEMALSLQKQELEEALKSLQASQAQLVQTEKMSSLGQLVAGVAHEINNPINFIHGNITHLQAYTQDLLDFVQLHRAHYPNAVPEIEAKAEEIELEFLQDDLGKILSSMKIGTSRIRQIVLSLRNFSRMDEAEFKAVDIHEGLDSTLLILQHRLKAKSDRPEIIVARHYDPLPLVECYAGQLNQVFMNVIANAIDAIDEVYAKQGPEETQNNPGCITITTSRLGADGVQIAIADSGGGMSEATRQRIFNPFFTTKPVGTGTGMGMSISHQIITERHRGKLDCCSTLGKGTEFFIQIPLRQPSQGG